LIEPAFKLANVRLHAVLKNDAELAFDCLGGFDERVARAVLISNGLFREDVEAMADGGRLPCAAWRPEGLPMMTTSMGDDEKGVEVLIGSAAVFAAEARDFSGLVPWMAEISTRGCTRGAGVVSVMLPPPIRPM